MFSVMLIPMSGQVSCGGSISRAVNICWAAGDFYITWTLNMSNILLNLITFTDIIFISKNIRSLIGK